LFLSYNRSVQVEAEIPVLVTCSGTAIQSNFLCHYYLHGHMIRVVQHRPCLPAGYGRTRWADCKRMKGKDIHGFSRRSVGFTLLTAWFTWLQLISTVMLKSKEPVLKVNGWTLNCAVCAWIGDCNVMTDKKHRTGRRPWPAPRKLGRGQSCGGVLRPCNSSAAVAAKVGNQFSGASLVNCALGQVTDSRAKGGHRQSRTNYRCYWSLKCRGDTPICISIMHCQSPREHFSFSLRVIHTAWTCPLFWQIFIWIFQCQERK